MFSGTRLINSIGEIENYKEGFLGIKSIIKSSNRNSNSDIGSADVSSSGEFSSRRKSSYYRASQSYSRRRSTINDLPKDIPIPNSVCRRTSIDSLEEESPLSDKFKKKRLTKAEVKKMVADLLKEESPKEYDIIKQSEIVKKQDTLSTSAAIAKTSKPLDTGMRNSMRRSSFMDKKKQILRTARRISDNTTPEIRTSLLDEIRQAIQMENLGENETNLIIADKHLENHEAKDQENEEWGQESDVPSSSWLEHITERLSLSARRVTELNDKIAATKKSSTLSIDSEENIYWSQKPSPFSKLEGSQSKLNLSEFSKSGDNKKLPKDKVSGMANGTKSSRNVNVSMKRVTSPSVLSDKGSWSQKSDDSVVHSKARKIKSAEKSRRSSVTSIKVGPAMTRQLEQNRTSSILKIKTSNPSPFYSRSNSNETIRNFVARSSTGSSKVIRNSKTARQNRSADRLHRMSTSRSQSSSSVNDPKFTLAEKRFPPKKDSLTNLIDLYYASENRRSTTPSLRDYHEAILKKNENNNRGRNSMERKSSMQNNSETSIDLYSSNKILSDSATFNHTHESGGLDVKSIASQSSVKRTNASQISFDRDLVEQFDDDALLSRRQSAEERKRRLKIDNENMNEVDECAMQLPSTTDVCATIEANKKKLQSRRRKSSKEVGVSLENVPASNKRSSSARKKSIGRTSTSMNRRKSSKGETGPIKSLDMSGKNKGMNLKGDKILEGDTDNVATIMIVNKKQNELSGVVYPERSSAGKEKNLKEVQLKESQSNLVTVFDNDNQKELSGKTLGEERIDQFGAVESNKNIASNTVKKDKDVAKKEVAKHESNMEATKKRDSTRKSIKSRKSLNNEIENSKGNVENGRKQSKTARLLKGVK